MPDYHGNPHHCGKCGYTEGDGERPFFKIIALWTRFSNIDYCQTCWEEYKEECRVDKSLSEC